MTTKQSHPQLTLKPKQQEIIMLLYRFRFLYRSHIQTILKHKHHSRILNWLNDLNEKQFIKQSYDKKFTSDPAVYSLAALSRKYLKNMPKIKPSLLDRVWRETKYTDQFKNHHLFLADIYLSLLTLANSSKAKLHFHTKTDLYGMEHLISPNPDAYFALEDNKNNIKRYFLDIFDDARPSLFRNRVRQYFQYFDSDEWQDSTNKPFPAIILICPSVKIKNHLYYYIRKKLENESSINFYLTTKDAVSNQGLTRDTLQKVILKD